MRLKKEKNALVLSHNYQIPEVQDAGDFVGDSLELALKAKEIAGDYEIIVMCGVDFMAETVKILSPEKKVLLPDLNAKCPMAAQLKKETLIEMKEKYPDAEVVLYVNTTAEAKALADICCTSANAEKVVNAAHGDVVLFGPDKNLAYFVQKRTGKKVVPVPEDGFCYTHRMFTANEIEALKKERPNAEVVAHPECLPEVQEIADRVASTSHMLKYCSESSAKEFIIATEEGLLYRLGKENPGKKFYLGCTDAVCLQQKEISMQDLYESLRDEKFEINLGREVMRDARNAIEKMLELK